MENSHTLLQKPYATGSKLLVLVMVIPPLIGNPYDGYLNLLFVERVTVLEPLLLEITLNTSGLRRCLHQVLDL